MSNSTTKDILGKINQIDSLSVDSGFNGISASDIISLTSTTIPPLSIDSNTINWGVPPTSISGGSFTYGSPNTVWTSTGTGTGYNWPGPGNVSVEQSGSLVLKGQNADININGKSLKSWMEKVEERLNILTPNTELEAEWDELKELGEQYRKLEQHCKEKAETWKKLKAMPPPQVD